MLHSLSVSKLQRPAACSQTHKIPATKVAPVRRSGRVQTLRQKRRLLVEVEREANAIQEQRLALVAFERKKQLEMETQRRREEREAMDEATRRLARKAREDEDWERHKQQHWKKQLRALERLEKKRGKELKRMIARHPPQIDLPFVYACQLERTGRGASESAKRLDVELDAFHEMCLGKQLLPEGKETVMHALCPSNPVLFAAVSGIQLWKNAMVLFVKDGDDETTIHQDEVNGRRVIFFEWLARRARQSVWPSTAQRLCQAQKGDECLRFNDTYYENADAGEGRHEPLLLFVQHSQGPYIYCGRLGYLGHRSSDPLEFRWQLLDVGSFDWPKVYGALASHTGSSGSHEVAVEVEKLS